MSRPFKRRLPGPGILRGMVRDRDVPPPSPPPPRRRRRVLVRLAAACLLLAGAGQAQAHRVQDQEQARARAGLQRKEFVPLARLLADALRRHPGYAIEVELEDDDRYEIEIMRHDGVVVELHYDARSGRLLETEIEDD